MSNVFDDEKKKNEKEAEISKVEKKSVESEKEKSEKEKSEKEKDNKKLEELKIQVKSELEAEGLEATKKAIADRTLLIQSIQKKKSKSSEDKEILKRELVARAKDNAKMPKDLGSLRPSQMTLEEMLQYCKDKKINYLKGDNTILLRARIKAFRNPGRAERLRMLENKPFIGKIA